MGIERGIERKQKETGKEVTEVSETVVTTLWLQSARIYRLDADISYFPCRPSRTSMHSLIRYSALCITYKYLRA